MRQLVIEECRKRANTDPSAVSIFAVIAVIFIGAAITAVIISGGKLSGILLAVFFVSVFFLIAYIAFIKPRRILKMAETGSFEYYMGTLTEKNRADADETAFYQLVIDGAVKYSCTDDQYIKAKIGDRYMAVYFGGDDPELCLKVMQKDII